MCRNICLHIAANCQSLLDGFPTSIREDEQLIQQRTQATYDLPTQAAQETTQVSADVDSMQAEHKHLAVVYRLARKRALKAVITDMESQATLLEWAHEQAQANE